MELQKRNFAMTLPARAELWKGITNSGVAEAKFHKTFPSKQLRKRNYVKTFPTMPTYCLSFELIPHVREHENDFKLVEV